MSAPELDVDRLRKCLALMRAGATAGERAAGMAAAKRVAASAGWTLEDAILHLDRRHAPPEATERASRRSGEPTPGPKAASVRQGPITLAELRVERERQSAWRRRRSAAADRRLQERIAEQERLQAEDRRAQAERDREWAEAKAGGAAAILQDGPL